jgi:AhpD family alkylhydroperoxidase
VSDGGAQPRLAPLAAGDWGDAEYAAYGAMLGVAGERVPRAGTGHRLDPMRFAVVGTMVHNPGLAQAFLSFNRHLLNDSTLPVRWRELSILRVAVRRQCAYEWGQHVNLALAAGITAAEIESLAAGNEGFGGAELAVLRATDEILSAHRLGDESWAALHLALTEAQVMDLIFVVGTYDLLAAAFESWRLQPEPDTAPLPIVGDPDSDPDRGDS